MTLPNRLTGSSTDQTCVALDLEATGLSADADDVIEVGAVKFRGPEVLETLSTFINPQRPLPPFITVLTGISPKELERAPTLAAVAGKLEAFVGPLPVVGHNIGFDLQFLRKKNVRLSGPGYDTFDLATMLLPDLPDYSLVSICNGLGVNTDSPHRALPDAQMSMAAFVRLVDALRRLNPEVLQEAARIARRCDWPLRQLFMQVAAEAGEAPLRFGEPGMEGVDLPALSKRLRVEQKAPQKQEGPIDLSPVNRVLGDQGGLATTLQHFEARPEQLQMAEAVARSFSMGTHLIAEAGTGTGKSLAYLVPAALYALRSGRRVVISTNTINLQEQIIGKDIPDALTALKAGGAVADTAEIRYALLKGRGNYLCLGRWSAMKSGDQPLTLPEAKTLIKVLLWLRSTPSGDRGELNLTPPEAGVWARLSAQGLQDGAGPCPLVRKGLCFYQAARQRAEAAHLVVANHALLTLDVRHGSLIPEYSHLIVDEAHNLEEVATTQWGIEVDGEAVDGFLARVLGGGPVGGGLLASFKLLSRTTAVAETRRKDLAALVGQIEADAQALRTHSGTLFRLVADFLNKTARGGAKEYDSRVHLISAVRAAPPWARILPTWEDMDLLFDKLDKGLHKLYSAAEQLAPYMAGVPEERLLEIEAVAQAVQELRSHLASIVGKPEESMVYWVSAGNQDQTVKLHGAPLHVGPALQASLFNLKEVAILTGATLSTEGNFEYVKERLRIEPKSELLLGSPFDYASLAMIYVPMDMPEPGAPTYQGALNKIIADVSRAAHGRTLALFTSRAALRATRQGLRDDLAQQGITVLGQGIDGSPRQLVRTFKANRNIVLLGSGSFWEGVDIAGDALSVLIITRLPFSVPSEPVFAARSQQFEDPFSHYAVPQAVIRFRQGFGRLIRRKTDRGVLVILDRRVFSKRYGAAFLDSIPRCARKIGPAADLPRETVRWLTQRPLQ